MSDTKIVGLQTCNQSIMPEVSVIVPVFNVEKYVEQCLNSLRLQTLQNIEIIVVDDGSTDASADICDAFATKDNRFKVIHKKNEGLSAARNEGLNIARADYIMFVDSDDWVELDYCEAPYRIATKTNADLVIFQRASIGKRKAIKQKAFPIEETVSKDEVLTSLWHYIGITVWNKLYHRSLYDGIRFPKGHYCEDIAVTHHVVYKAQKIFLLNKCLYNYRNNRKGSISNHRDECFLIDCSYYHFKRIEELKAWGYNCSDEEKRVALWYLSVIGRDTEAAVEFDKIIREKKGFSSNYIPWIIKAMYWVYRLSPSVFDFMSIISGKRIRYRL